MVRVYTKHNTKGLLTSTNEQKLYVRRLKSMPPPKKNICLKQLKNALMGIMQHDNRFAFQKIAKICSSSFSILKSLKHAKLVLFSSPNPQIRREKTIQKTFLTKLEPMCLVADIFFNNKKTRLEYTSHQLLHLRV